MTPSKSLSPAILISAIALAALAVGLAGVLGYLMGSTSSTSLTRNTSPTSREQSPKPAAVEQALVLSPTPPTNPNSRPEQKPNDDPSPVPPPVAAMPPQVPSDVPRVGVLKPNVEPAGRYQLGDVIHQEVVFTRQSQFRTAGIEMGLGAQYGLTSTITITKVNDDGSVAAEQTIRKTKLIDADQNVKASLSQALEKVQNTTFSFTIKSNGEVARFDGPQDPIRVLAGPEAASGQTIRMWSLLDADAWKELSGLTFFQPEKPLNAKATWTKPFAHDWSPLGNWRGHTVYLAAGKQPGKPNLERIHYGHEVTYTPPVAGADKQLPFQVSKADFKTILAGGVIVYDPATRRSTGAEETFRVRGAVQVSLNGVNAIVDMEESQGFRMIVKEPTEREIVGKRPRK